MSIQCPECGAIASKGFAIAHRPGCKIEIDDDLAELRKLSEPPEPMPNWETSTGEIKTHSNTIMNWQKIWDEFNKIKKLNDGWDTYNSKASNNIVSDNVKYFLKMLQKMNIKPFMVDPSFEGEMVVMLGNYDNGICFEFLNDGLLIVTVMINGEVAWNCMNSNC